MRKDFYGINETLSDILQKGEPASVMRIDNTAGYIMDCMHKGVTPVDQYFNANSIMEGGMWPNTKEFATKVYGKTLDAMKRADIVGFVDISGEISRSNFVDQFKDQTTFFVDGFLIMDPAAILNYAQMGGQNTIYIGHLTQRLFTPWTFYLKGKKVLVVSTHVETIKSQWNKIDKVWPSDKDKIVPFDLVGAVRSPYHPDIDSRQYPNCKDWFDTIECMKAEIDTFDYDVLLSGASTSSPLLVDHAKSRGKIGIQTGGTLQLFFGILGKRWTDSPAFKDWYRMFNENWTYPSFADQPQNKVKVAGLETSYAYWG